MVAVWVFGCKTMFFSLNKDYHSFACWIAVIVFEIRFGFLKSRDFLFNTYNMIRFSDLSNDYSKKSSFTSEIFMWVRILPMNPRMTAFAFSFSPKDAPPQLKSLSHFSRRYGSR